MLEKMTSKYDSTQNMKGKHRGGVDDQPNRPLRGDMT